MAIETFEIVIDGHQYEVQQLPGMQAISVAAELKDILQDGLAELANAFADYYMHGEMGESLNQDLSSIVRQLLKNIDKKEIGNLIMRMMNGVTVDGKDMSKQAAFDNHYAGSMVELFYALKFIIECNFGDVFQLAGLSTSEASA